MQRKEVVTITSHGNDWCHLCGKRQEHLADVWYKENAEHAFLAKKARKKYESKEHDKYIRICDECGQRIACVAVVGDTPYLSKGSGTGTIRTRS